MLKAKFTISLVMSCILEDPETEVSSTESIKDAKIFTDIKQMLNERIQEQPQYKTFEVQYVKGYLLRSTDEQVVYGITIRSKGTHNQNSSQFMDKVIDDLYKDMKRWILLLAKWRYVLPGCLKVNISDVNFESKTIKRHIEWPTL